MGNLQANIELLEAAKKQLETNTSLLQQEFNKKSERKISELKDKNILYIPLSENIKVENGNQQDHIAVFDKELQNFMGSNDTTNFNKIIKGGNAQNGGAELPEQEPNFNNIYIQLYNTLIFCYIRYNKIIYSKEFKFIEYIINNLKGKEPPPPLNNNFE